MEIKRFKLFETQSESNDNINNAITLIKKIIDGGNISDEDITPEVHSGLVEIVKLMDEYDKFGYVS